MILSVTLPKPIRSTLQISHVVGCWLTPLVFFAAGCAQEKQVAQWAVTADTLPNGIVHVVNTPPPVIEPTWLIEEELRIGSVDAAGPTSFGEVRGIAVTEDGRVAVLDTHAQELRVFSLTGEHLATFGGKGGGPGEMENGYGLMLGPGGWLWVPDSRNARMSVYNPDHGFDRSYRVHFLTYAFIWQGIMTADAYVLKPSITLDSDQTRMLRVFDVEMKLVDSLPLPEYPPADPENPPNAFYYEAPGGAEAGYRRVPFYPQRQELLDPFGVIWSTEFGDPSYRIARWAPGGDTTLVLETRRPLASISTAERDSAIERLSEGLPDWALPQFDWSKIPDSKPAVTSMFVADDGRLWVRAASADTLINYDVYGRDGRWAGTAVTSLRVWPYLRPIVRGDRFWAVVTDEFDVAYVVRGRLKPAGSQRIP